MTTRREILNGVLFALPACAIAADEPAPPVAKLFAVEFRTGPSWTRASSLRISRTSVSTPPT